jgi:Nucleotidyl transferase AbiEii toxin, Type IV TA system
MSAEIFDQFRLVGGTSLSLQIGHRTSVDIDLFTDAQYGTIDFTAIDQFFRHNYRYVETNAGLPIGIGSSWFLGVSENDAVKVDLYYTDPCIRRHLEEELIRIASKEDIIAMKLEVPGHSEQNKKLSLFIDNV